MVREMFRTESGSWIEKTAKFVKIIALAQKSHDIVVSPLVIIIVIISNLNFWLSLK